MIADPAPRDALTEIEMWREWGRGSCQPAYTIKWFGHARMYHDCLACSLLVRNWTCEWTDQESERWPEPMEEPQGCSKSVRSLSSLSAIHNSPPNFWIMSEIRLVGSPWGNAQGVIVWCWLVKMNGFPLSFKFGSKNAHTGQHHLDTPKVAYIIIFVKQIQAGYGNGGLTDPAFWRRYKKAARMALAWELPMKPIPLSSGELSLKAQ